MSTEVGSVMQWVRLSLATPAFYSRVSVPIAGDCSSAIQFLTAAPGKMADENPGISSPATLVGTWDDILPSGFRLSQLRLFMVIWGMEQWFKVLLPFLPPSLFLSLF